MTTIATKNVEKLRLQGKERVPVIITGNENETTIGIIRALGRRGVPVTLIKYHPPTPAYSRYIKEKLTCSNPKNSEIQFIDFLLDQGKRLGSKTVIIPSDDAGILSLSKYKQELD